MTLDGQVLLVHQAQEVGLEQLALLDSQETGELLDREDLWVVQVLKAWPELGVSLVNKVHSAALVHLVRLETLVLLEIQDPLVPLDSKASRANLVSRELLGPLALLDSLDRLVLLAKMGLLGRSVDLVL